MTNGSGQPGPPLICFDGSASAGQAIQIAGAVLKGSCILLHVWTQPDAVLADSFSTRDSGVSGGVLEGEATRRSHEILAQGTRLAEQAGLDVEGREARAQGAVADTIRAVADELDAAVIVIGTHGETAVQDQPLGSVSSSLVHRSHRPVLIVPASA